MTVRNLRSYHMYAVKNNQLVLIRQTNQPI
jgi:hypothetical protein